MHTFQYKTQDWIKNNYKEGKKVKGIVKNIKPYGAFIEIEGGVVGLAHIEDLSIARIKTPYERLQIGQKVDVVVKSIEKNTGRITLSYKETLGTWEENANKFSKGMKTKGIIRETEKNKNGIFIELTPNLVGMAEYEDGLEYGKTVDVLIKKIDKEKKKVKFVITLTREEKDNYLHGHLTKEMIEPFIKEFNTVLMCGPKELYRSMNEILNEFNIPRKSVHYENFFVEYIPEEKTIYKLKVVMKDKVEEITCKNDETLLVAMEHAGIKAPSLCRVGECGYCRSILLEGKVKMIGASLKKAETENDYIHPCVSFPDSDIVLKLDI